MPDGMSSENKPQSSFDYMRSFGKPADLPAADISEQAAKDFPQPESIANVPDIRMQLGGKKEGDGDGENRDIEDALNNRLYYGHESLAAEQISSAEDPQELFYGLRHLERQLEDGNIPGPLTERYTPPRELAIMYEKASLLSIKPDELVGRGWIKNYNPSTGEGSLRHRKYASLAISVEDSNTPHINDRSGMESYYRVQKYNFGTPEKRAELAKAYERAMTELEARAILDEHIGVRLSLGFRDSLEELTSIMHSGRLPYFKNDHLEALFNMPDVSELASNPENHKLGDQVEEAMFLNLVMLNSGNKKRMLEFLERPGSKFLIAKLAKENNMNYDDWKDMYIGKVGAWEDDDKRDLKKTWRLEQSDGRRGPLTKWANIPAWGGNPGEFGADKEREFIEGVVGKLVGSTEAAWVAATTMRVIGAYASEGYVALPNGKSSLLPLGEGRYMSGDDTGKFYAYMFNMKEGLSGRSCGLKDMIGKIPDMAMNLFDWAGIEMDDLSRNPDGSKQKRSIWDAWLGTTGGKAKLDLLTLKPTASTTTEEPYHRLGSLNFKSLEREFHGTFTIMQWLMGNREGPTGVFIDAMRTDFRFEDFSLDQLKKKVKYIGIVMNPVVLTKGSPHLYDNVDDSGKVIRKNFLRNLMLARIHSASFSTGILNMKTRLFNPEGGGDAEVPAAVMIRACIKEALKANPATEEMLKQHYIDENEKLRTMGKNRTPGIRDDVSALLTETFEPDDPKEKALTGYVGRVMGKNI